MSEEKEREELYVYIDVSKEGKMNVRTNAPIFSALHIIAQGQQIVIEETAKQYGDEAEEEEDLAQKLVNESEEEDGNVH